MDIRIGAPPPIGGPGHRREASGNAIEARVLAVRSPRRRDERPGTEKRSKQSAGRDPSTGRVLVLMIPDGGSLPAGLESGQYRVFLRLVRR